MCVRGVGVGGAGVWVCKRVCMGVEVCGCVCGGWGWGVRVCGCVSVYVWGLRCAGVCAGGGLLLCACAVTSHCLLILRKWSLLGQSDPDIHVWHVLDLSV